MADELGAVGGTGVVAADPGGAGGAGEIGGGAPEGGGIPPVVEPSGEPPVESGEPAEPADGTEPEEPAEPAEDAEFDDRTIDAKTRNDLAALKKVNPESAKRMSDTYHRARAIMQEVNATSLSQAVNNVRQIVGTLDALGGEAGIQEMQTAVRDYETEITQFRDGDPELLNQLYGTNADSAAAFVKQASNGLELLASKDPVRFDEAIMPSMVARMERAGLYDSMPRLLEFIKAGDGDKAFDLAGQIHKWLGDAKGFAGKQVSLQKEKNPEREKLDKDRAEYNQQKAIDYDNSIGADVNKLNNAGMSRVVEPFFKELKLKDEGRHEFVNALQSRIWKKMGKDEPFQRAAHAIKSKGDIQRTSKFVNAKFQELLPDEFRALRNAMYPSYKAAAPAKPRPAGTPAAPAAPGAKPAAAPTGPVVMSAQPPPRGDVDWGKTPDASWIGGTAMLKNGKIMKWNWTDVR